MPQESSDQKIQAEIDRLREAFPNTQDLYREACVLLFFRFGITPTANKLYQFVRKGSMSAPTEAVGKFWENLRQKSRVRIENPDLPDDLREAAGNLTAALWTKAQQAARASLEALREQSRQEVEAAGSAQKQAEAKSLEIAENLHQAQLLIELKTQSLQDLEAALAAEQAARSGLEDRLDQAQDESTRLHQTLADTRRDFAAELERMRAASALAEERLRASEERALIEIDRERTLAARVQKDLESARRAAAEADERNRVEANALRDSLGQAQQRCAMLEGNLDALQSAKRDLSAEISDARVRAIEAAEKLAVGLREREIALVRVRDLEIELAATHARVAELTLAEARHQAEDAAKRRVRRIVPSEKLDI